jgi:hypothetical protein
MNVLDIGISSTFACRYRCSKGQNNGILLVPKSSGSGSLPQILAGTVPEEFTPGDEIGEISESKSFITYRCQMTL